MLKNNFDLVSMYSEKTEMKTIEEVFSAANFYRREYYLGDVCSEAADNFEAFVRFWNDYDNDLNVPVAEREPIKVFIDSGGGDLIAAFTIIDSINLSKTPIWTINTGAAYSAGFFIFIAGHRRLTYALSSFMFHEGGVSGGSFDAHKFRNHADFYSTQLKQLKEHTLKCTGWTSEFYEKIQKDDYWLTAPEAIEKGVADEIVMEGI